MQTITDDAAMIFWPLMFPNGFKLNEAQDDKQSMTKKKAQITSKLWENVLIMRKNASPMEGAHARDDMPQTGYTADKLGNI